MIVVFFAATAPNNASSYQVVASATAGTNYNAATSAAYTFTITPANACGTYTGEYFKNTTYATGGSTYTRLRHCTYQASNWLWRYSNRHR